MIIEVGKDGFAFNFNHIPHPPSEGFKLIPMFERDYMQAAVRIEVCDKSLEDYQAYINKYGIDKAEIIMPDLRILQLCPSLKYLRIFPSLYAPEGFDFSPLYELHEVKSLHCRNVYGPRGKYSSEIDYSKIHGLVKLSVDVNKKVFNFNKVDTLKSLSVGSFKGASRDLTDMFCSQELDTLEIQQCGIYSLNGIETSRKMQCVYLYYNRSLSDISALSRVKGTLRALHIMNCPKIQDFSVLGELENLEMLDLQGNNSLPSLDFLKNLKNLKTFIFNMNVLDGDLSPCLNLSYVYSVRNRKHYNLKDCELPKVKYVWGNEDIEGWRRLYS